MENLHPDHARALARRLSGGARAWLILDYDGTLADFAPTPDMILPDRALIQLVDRLSRFPDHLRLAVLSGRMVAQIRQLVPIPGVLLAGTYGVEYINFAGEMVRLLDLGDFRPHLDQVKRGWETLISGRDGFFLEDKGYTIALHAKNAAVEDARVVMPTAHRAALEANLPEFLNVSEGHLFLEVSHMAASKGKAIDLLMDRFSWPGAEIFFIGDSDQDEPAFEAVRRWGGVPVVVTRRTRKTHALYCMGSPQEVRAWLGALAEGLEEGVRGA